MAKRYYGMHTLLLRILLNLYNNYERKIDDVYLVRIAEITKKQEELIQRTVEKINSEPAKYRGIYKTNLAAQGLTVRTAKMYDDYLRRNKKRVADAKSGIAHEYEVALNTFETVQGAHSLMTLMQDANAMLDRSMDRKWSVALILCCLLVGTCLLSTGTILFIVKSQSDQAAIESAKDYFKEVTDKTAAKLNAFIEPVAALANVAGATLSRDEEGSGRGSFSKRFESMKAMLDSNSQLMSAYIGYEDGSFYQVIAPRGTQKILTKYEAPEGCAYIERLIQVDESTGSAQRWRFYDSSQHLLGARFDSSSYDPRIRPWYRQALLSCG
ncbi:GAF domain-containing protein, partial [Aduncisulcus paluster]